MSPIAAAEGIARDVHPVNQGIVQLIANGCLRFRINQICHFAGVSLQIVELVRSHEIDGQLVASVTGTANRLKRPEAIVIYLIAAPFGEDFVVDDSNWVLEQAAQKGWQL